MIHICKKVNIKSFQSNIYNHIGAVPVVITKRGVPTAMMASLTNASTIADAIDTLTDLQASLGKGVDDEKEKHNHGG